MSIKSDLFEKKNARAEIDANIKNMTELLRKLMDDPTQKEEVVRAMSGQLELMAAVSEYFKGDVKLDKEIERIYSSKILS